MNVAVTLGEMKRAIDGLIKHGVSEGAAVLWATNVEEGSDYHMDYGAAPGSVLLGLEWIEDGELIRGTAELAPGKISRFLM